ncbi:MAG: toll/interleukin-1 receptor domain-containing protein, partial [Zoogloea sp.]|nr:toll/interleukin-1 receptor domain-containing protein [Zoogloea sp.]
MKTRVKLGERRSNLVTTNPQLTVMQVAVIHVPFGRRALGASNDLFLSYRWADTAAVAPLVTALRARGVRVWQDAREVDDLASIQQAVSNGLAGARALLAWYSSRYNESRACQWELTSAYCAAQAEGDPRRRILVVNPEPGNAHVHLPELFDQLHLNAQPACDDPQVVDALADRIHAVLRDTVPGSPIGELRALTPPRWLPTMGTGSTRFVGRQPEMWALHGKLLANQAAMLTGTGGKPGVTLVRGAGGIGKSLLAEEYALRFGAAYPGGVFWLRAYGHPDGGTAIEPAQRAAMRNAQLLDLAAGLGIDIRGLEPPQVRAAMAAHFNHDGQPFLWVVDDLPSDLGTEGLGDWLAPHPLGRTLFTSRTRRFTHVPTLDLPQLDPDEARSLLTRQSALTADEAGLADEICKLLGFHALAVDVTAALVERRGLAGTLEALERADQDVLDLAAQFEEALPNGHQRHIAATFLASIGQLDEHARKLLRLAAVLAAAPIPRRLLVRCVGAAARLEDDDAQDDTDLAIDRLLSASLADDAGGGAINVHTLVSRTMRFADGSPEALATWREHAVGALTKEMKQAADIRRHAHLEPWVEHARELSGANGDLATVELLGRVARYDYERAAYALARRGFEQQRDVRKRLLGDEHPDTLTSMGNLATTLREQGDLPDARRLEEAALELSKRVLGEAHPATLRSMNNLAVTLRNQGDLPGARRLQEAVLALSKHVLGEAHPDTLTSMSNLAMTLREQGDLPGAKRLQEAVLEVRKRVLDEAHPDT